MSQLIVGPQLERSNYCDRCVRMMTLEGLRALASESGYQYYTKSEIKESVARGCPLCRMLSPRYDTPVPLKDTDSFVFFAHLENLAVWRKLNDATNHGPFMLDSLQAHSFSPDVHYGIGLTLFTSPDDISAKLIPNRPVFTGVGTEFAMTKAREWLQECHTSHSNCPPARKPKLPTRVIDVGLGRGMARVKLHSSNSFECDQYVALSYCWGGPQHVTTTENLASMEKEIPLDKLSKTILDAIKVTQSLKIKYLWVDALCIVQNSDKSAEIDRMGEIYKNATVTIVASSAKSASEGFLQVREAPEYHALPFIAPDGSLGSVFIMDQTEQDPLEPLNKRGWTLQEWLLSPRKLLYGKRELVWYCEVDKYKTITKSPIRCRESLAKLPSRVFQQGKDVRDPAEDILEWSRVVGEFCKRFLTEKEDRLQALAGIIKELSPLYQDQCSFGLWHRHFVSQLTWCRIRHLEDRNSGRLNCAPSWSWASSYFEAYGGYLLQPFELPWKLESRTLIITAKLLGYCNVDDGVGVRKIYWDYPSTGNVDYLFANPLPTKAEGLEIYYLFLGEVEKKGWRCFMGLVLGKIRDQTFRRTGVFCLNFPSSVFQNAREETINII